MGRDKEVVMVRIPCGLTITNGLALFLVNLGAVGRDDTCPFTFHIGLNQNFKPADFARNVAVKQFLRSRATKLWMVDSDTIPPMPESLRLLHTPGDIVCGYYFIFGNNNGDGEMKLQPTTYEYHESVGAWKSVFIEPGEVRAIDAAGTGMMLISRRVLEDKRMWVGEEDERCVPVFRNLYGNGGFIQVSEDMDFCKRARDLGYTIVGLGDVLSDHVKTLGMTSVADWGAARYAEGAESGRPKVIPVGST